MEVLALFASRFGFVSMIHRVVYRWFDRECAMEMSDDVIVVKLESLHGLTGEQIHRIASVFSQEYFVSTFFGILVHSVPDIFIKRMAYSDFKFLHYFSMLRYSTYIHVFRLIYSTTIQLLVYIHVCLLCCQANSKYRSPQNLDLFQ